MHFKPQLDWRTRVVWASERITEDTICHYSTPSLSNGHKKRGFCPEFARIYGGENPEQGYIGLTASSLDDPSWLRIK